MVSTNSLHYRKFTKVLMETLEIGESVEDRKED